MAFEQAKQQRRTNSPENQPCEAGAPCYRGPAAPELLLGEFRELCTGDPRTPITYETSRSCVQEAIYGDIHGSAPPARSPYFGLAVDQIAPEDESVEPRPATRWSRRPARPPATGTASRPRPASRCSGG